MVSIPDDFYHLCRTVFLQCDEFDCDPSLRAIFVIEKLRPFRDGLRTATSKRDRVDLFLDYVLDKRFGSEPVLLIFLEVLCTRYPDGIALRDELNNCTIVAKQIWQDKVSSKSIAHRTPNTVNRQDTQQSQIQPSTNSQKSSQDPEDKLEYEIEKQPWYAKEFPPTAVIPPSHCELLKQEIDVVIITATPVELKAVVRLLKDYPGKDNILKVSYEHETYYLGLFGVYKTVVTMCGMGSIGEDSVVFATVDAQRLWNPRAIIMVGIAFGKDPKTQKIADVLVASDIIRYDESQRIGTTEINDRCSIPPSNTTLLNRFKNAFDWKFTRPDSSDCKPIIGAILSGQKLVDNLDFKTKLFERFPHAVGGEMEGDGLSAAAGRLSKPWILVKSICDWADGKKNKKHQPLAAAAAASLVHHVLSEPYVIDSLKKN